MTNIFENASAVTIKGKEVSSINVDGNYIYEGEPPVIQFISGLYATGSGNLASTIVYLKNVDKLPSVPDYYYFAFYDANGTEIAHTNYYIQSNTDRFSCQKQGYHHVVISKGSKSGGEIVSEQTFV